MAVARIPDWEAAAKLLIHTLKSKVAPGKEIASLSLWIPPESEGGPIHTLLIKEMGFRPFPGDPPIESEPSSLLFYGLTSWERKSFQPKELSRLSIDEALMKLQQMPSPISEKISSPSSQKQAPAAKPVVRRGKTLQVQIRWMIRRDMPEVLAIEKSSFEFSWSEEDYIRALKRCDCIGMVAEDGDRIVGFMIYELHKKHLHLLNLAVHPEFRFRGVGRQMVKALIQKLSSQRRNRILVEVRERNTQAQLFFKQMGFRAVAVLHNFYEPEQTTEEAYQMEYRLPSDEAAGLEESPAEAFLRALLPEASLETIPLIITAGLEERFPALSKLNKFERYGVVLQGNRNAGELLADLINQNPVFLTRVKAAGLESEMPAFREAARLALVGLEELTPEHQQFEQVLLTIFSALSGLEEESIQRHQGFQEFMAGLESLSPAA